MGLKLGRLLRKVVKTGVPLVSGFLAGGPAGALMAGTGLLAAKAQRSFAPVAAGVPSIEQVTGVSPFFAQPVMQRNGGLAVPAMAGVPQVGALGIRLMTQNAARAILKLATIFGLAGGLPNLASVGRRLFRVFRVFARRHPTMSIISMLVALGLTVEEASEWFFWGEATTRRRRGRGISARDIRVARRTIRKVAAFQRDLVGLHRHRGRARGRDGVVVARAG